MRKGSLMMIIIINNWKCVSMAPTIHLTLQNGKVKKGQNSHKINLFFFFVVFFVLFFSKLLR